jgi:hypothetical protein
MQVSTVSAYKEGRLARESGKESAWSVVSIRLRGLPFNRVAASVASAWVTDPPKHGSTEPPFSTMSDKLNCATLKNRSVEPFPLAG